MPSTFSPDKNYELMSQGENNGTWGNKTNANLSIIDLNLGGRLNISVAGNTDVVISQPQATNVFHVITGVLTGSINYDLPNKGSFYFLSNGTTGSFTITARAAGGTGIVIPQGSTQMVFINPDTSAASFAFSYGGGISTSTVNLYTAQQNFSAVVLNSVANSVAWNLNTSQTGVHSLVENTTLANPTNMVNGGTYILKVVQGTPAKTLSFGTAYKWGGGVAPIVSTGNGAVDIITFYSDGTSMFGSFQQNFS